jgi:hypothetical protein
MIKSRRMKWAGHVAGMGKEECMQDIGRKARREHWEDQDVGGWIIIKWISER